MKNILFFALVTFTFQINAQSYNDKIETLMELDGTMSILENILSKTIENQKENNFGISDQYWDSLITKVRKKALNDFKDIVIPMYNQTYSESEVDNLVTFYNSETGTLISEKQSEIQEKLRLGLIQWFQNFNAYVISEIENRGKNESSPDALEKFKTEFKAKYGLQILNLTDLAIDQEYNPGELLLDFGRTNGEEDVTKIIRVKNNSNEEIKLEIPAVFNNEAIRFDLGNKPLQIGETRDLKITLIADQAENKSFAYVSLNSNDGNRISFGIRYDAPAKELSVEVSDKKLKLRKQQRDLSKPYIFILKNTGEKEFHISDIKTDSPMAYLNYSKDVIEPNKTAEIKVILSKAFSEKLELKNDKLTLKVTLKKGSEDGFSGMVNKTIELTIE